MTQKLGDLIGENLEEDFTNFDLTDIKSVLDKLQNIEPIDLAHAEMLSQQALRGADIITEYLGKIVKTLGYLESKINKAKNKASLDYKAPDGTKTTTDMKIWAGAASDEVEAISMSLARAKASKVVLEKKYDLLIRCHHHHKDIAGGLRRTILGTQLRTVNHEIPEGYE